MSKSRNISVIDLGSSKITTLIGQTNFDEFGNEVSLNVIGVSSSPSRGIKKGQIVDIEEAVEATITSVEAAERMAGFNLDRAYVSVGGGHISSLNSSGVVAISSPDKEIVPEDVDRVVEAARAVSLPASREIIHVMPREYIVDGEAGVRDPVGMTGVRLEVDTHLVTASSPALKNLSKTVEEVGIDIQELVFSGLASSYSTVTDTEKELGCVLVDIGSGTTSVAAFVEGALAYSTGIPIGAKNVTNDLAIGLRVSLDKAEEIKLGLDRLISKKEKQVEISDDTETKTVQIRTLTEGIIKPRLNEIFSMVRLELEKAGLLNRIPSGAIITGGGSLTLGTVDSAKRTLGLPVRLAKPSGVGGLIDDILEPQYATPVGLLIYASRQNIDVSANMSLTRGVKFPNSAIIGKIINSIRDLLP